MIKIRAKLLTSIKDRGIGLIGKRKAVPVMFITRFGIHTMGMKFPVDAIVLDKSDRVVKMIESLPPNRFFIWPIKYNKVLELPAGFIKLHKINIGEQIKLKAISDEAWRLL